MNISQNGIELLKHFEGCSFLAYPDPATGGNPWTIGYGHTDGVTPSDRIDLDTAEEYLKKDLERFEIGVFKITGMCSQEQFDALVSFSFNLGLINLERSRLLKLHNEGKYQDVPAQFLRWNRANGKVMPGLTSRRMAESLLYSGKEWRV